MAVVQKHVGAKLGFFWKKQQNFVTKFVFKMFPVWQKIVAIDVEFETIPRASRYQK